VLATSVLDDAFAWIGLPALYALSGLGVGLLVERALGLRMHPAALIPLGACTSICALLAIYRLKLDWHATGPLLLVAALAGFGLARHELRTRLAPSAGALAGLTVLGLYLAPTVLTGHWSWNGYNYLNDTAVQFLLADQLQHHGAQQVQDAFSTGSESIRSYLGSGYPLGSHAHVATLAALLGGRVDVIYQSYLAMLAVTAALSLYVLAMLSGLPRARAAAAGAGAMSASLIYHYALQGSIKEVAASMCLAAAAMFGAQLLASDRPARAVVPVGIAGAAMISVFSSAAAPYLIALAVALAGAVFLSRAAELQRRLVPVAGVGAVAVLVAAIPTLLSALTFLRVSNTALAADAVATSTLGQLQRPLEPLQMAGVWLSEDYGLPVSGDLESDITSWLIWLVLGLAALGIVVFLRRRVPGPLPLLFAVVATTAALASRASPYADAKLFALASPPIVFTALCGALSWRSARWRLPGLFAAAVAGLAVISSAAFAYHGVRIASVDRLAALEDVVDRIPGRPWILLDEVEEFGKYYGRSAPHFNVAFEAITPRQAEPWPGGYHLDLDQLLQSYVQGFDVIVTRHGPSTSRPPANFRPLYENRWYGAWRRTPRVKVRAHLPLQRPLDAGQVPRCRDVRRLAQEARPGDGLVAAPSPETAEMPVVDAPDRPLGWPPLAWPEGVVEPRSPGEVEKRLMLRGGDYDVWVRASTGRRVTVSVDGRAVGGAKGLNTIGLWLPVGSTRLAAGDHLVRLERPGGGLAPGDGVKSQLGPVALVRRESNDLVAVAPRDARRLCGRRWDWIEVVAR